MLLLAALVKASTQISSVRFAASRGGSSTSRLWLEEEVVESIITASRSEVRGWVQLHRCLTDGTLEPPDESPESAATSQKAGSMLSACTKFSRIPFEECHKTVTAQKLWLDKLLGTLLDDLLVEKNSNIKSVIRMTLAFVLHLISGENEAAMQCVIEEVALLEAIGFRRFGSRACQGCRAHCRRWSWRIDE